MRLSRPARGVCDGVDQLHRHLPSLRMAVRGAGPPRPLHPDGSRVGVLRRGGMLRPQGNTDGDLMSVPAEDFGRVPIQIPRVLHKRIARIALRMRAETGRTVTFAEVVERALDRAAMEEDQ